MRVEETSVGNASSSVIDAQRDPLPSATTRLPDQETPLAERELSPEYRQILLLKAEQRQMEGELRHVLASYAKARRELDAIKASRAYRAMTRLSVRYRKIVPHRTRG